MNRVNDLVFNIDLSKTIGQFVQQTVRDHTPCTTQTQTFFHKGFKNVFQEAEYLKGHMPFNSNS